jgi:hypothetical protein
MLLALMPTSRLVDVQFFDEKGSENQFNCKILLTHLVWTSTGPAAEPSGRFRPPLRAGGGWGPPLCIGIQEVGTYIYSRTYTTH